MIIYDFGCAEGHVFEAAVASMASPCPPCPACGADTRRRPSRLNTTGASAGVSREEMPRSWRGVANGDRETIRHWREAAVKRERLEEKYPDLGGDRRPVLAHEGIFAGRPLRAGDDVPRAVDEAHAAAAATVTRSSSSGAAATKEGAR